MLRKLRALLATVAVALCLGLGSSAWASGIFERDRLFLDREDVLEELILRDRLIGRPFFSPFFSPFAFGRDRLVLDLLLAEELADELFEDRFERDRFDFGDFDFDDDDDDDDD